MGYILAPTAVPDNAMEISVSDFCHAIMAGVTRIMDWKPGAEITDAVAVMRKHVKGFLFGDMHKDLRDAAIEKTISSEWVVAALCLEICSELKQSPQTGSDK